MTLRLIAVVLSIVGTLLASACSSPLVGTWLAVPRDTDQSEVKLRQQPDEINLMVVRPDRTCIEYSIRNGRAQAMNPSRYTIKGDVFMTEDEPGWGCIRGTTTCLYQINGKRLILDYGDSIEEFERID